MTIKLEELRALIALKMCDGIGDATANKLLLHLGSASAVFEEKSMHLSTIPGINNNIEILLRTGIPWSAVDQEVEFIEKNNLSYTSVIDHRYPKRLLKIDSPPSILFHKGTIDALNSCTCISLVGTRLPTPYGIGVVEEIIEALAGSGTIIISGLAHGIDITAHKACISKNVITYGIVGHGLKTIYPSRHREYAGQMINHGGGIITEFFSGELPNRENFPKRNRIIAGLSSATLVIEASKKSGTLITADLALDYNRKVFVLPGRISDPYSEGCNLLLSKPKVKPILSISSLLDDLGLSAKPYKPIRQVPVLEGQEYILFDLLSSNSKISLDEVASKSNLSISQCSSILLGMEIKGLVRSLPGKSYELC